MSCSTGLHNTIKKILNKKPWYRYVIQGNNGIIHLLNSQKANINFYTSYDAAIAVAAHINNSINNGEKIIGDVAFPRKDYTEREVVIIEPLNAQLDLLNTEDASEIIRLQDKIQTESETIQQEVVSTNKKEDANILNDNIGTIREWLKQGMEEDTFWQKVEELGVSKEQINTFKGVSNDLQTKEHSLNQNSEEQFKEYFINNKQEFTTSIAKNKYVIEGFKDFVQGKQVKEQTDNIYLHEDYLNNSNILNAPFIPPTDNQLNLLKQLDNKSVKEVLEFVISNTQREDLKYVAEVYLKNVNKIHFVKFKSTPISGLKGGHYDAGKGEILFNPLIALTDTQIIERSGFEKALGVILHEFSHTFTVNALFKPKNKEEVEFKNFITEQFKYYKQITPFKDNYGFKNEREFISEILTNRDFRNDLYYRENKKEIKNNYLKNILDKILKFLGFKTNNVKEKSPVEIINTILSFVNDYSKPNEYTKSGIIVNNIEFQKLTAEEKAKIIEQVTKEHSKLIDSKLFSSDNIKNFFNDNSYHQDSSSNQFKNTNTPDVILPIGTSGSGKSTFIKSLSQENLVVIEPDAMRVEFTGNMNDKSRDKEIYIEAANRAIAALQGKETPNQIYNKLGSKTKEGNVVIKSIYQTAGIQYAKSIGGVFSLRINNTNNQFGNPFSNVESEIQKGLIRTKSTKESVEKYIEWILSPATTIKPEQHKFIREWLQSGKLKGKPIVYYKELGEPSHATALDYLINKYDWDEKPKQVVFDTTNLTKDKRLPFIEAIKKEIPNANIQYKLMELNPELAKQRIKAQLERGENRANVSDATIDRHAASYEQMLEDIKSEPITPYGSDYGFTISAFTKPTDVYSGSGKSIKGIDLGLDLDNITKDDLKCK